VEPALLVVWAGVGDTVCDDGGCGLVGVEATRFRLKGRNDMAIGVGDVWDTVGFECLVVNHLLWLAQPGMGFCRDRFVVGRHRWYDRRVLAYLEACGVAVGPLHFMGQLCGVFELHHLGPEQDRRANGILHCRRHAMPRRNIRSPHRPKLRVPMPLNFFPIFLT